MTQMSFKKNRTKLVSILSITVVALLVMALFYFLFREKTTYSTADYSIDNTTSLSCEITNPENSFFNIEKNKETSIQIKVIFEEDELSKISYNLLSEHDTKENAEQTNAKIHAYYNESLSSHGISPESYYPTFSVIDNEVHVNIYSERKNLNSVIGGVFFLTSEDMAHLDINHLQKAYREKGFNCVANK